MEQAQQDNKAAAKLLKADTVYMRETPALEELVKELFAAVLAERPADITAFLAEYLQRKRG